MYTTIGTLTSTCLCSVRDNCTIIQYNNSCSTLQRRHQTTYYIMLIWLENTNTHVSLPALLKPHKPNSMNSKCLLNIIKRYEYFCFDLFPSHTINAKVCVKQTNHFLWFWFWCINCFVIQSLTGCLLSYAITGWTGLNV